MIPVEQEVLDRPGPERLQCVVVGRRRNKGVQEHQSVIGAGVDLLVHAVMCGLGLVFVLG